MTDPRRQRFTLYLRRLADLIGLKDWIVEVSDDEPDEKFHLASVECIYGQKRAVVYLSGVFLDKDATEQRETLVHELIHAHLASAERIVREAWDGDRLGPFLLAMEYAVDGIAMAWAEGLPLPPGQDNSAPRAAPKRSKRKTRGRRP